ncbi:PREDICTED: uncharacterized oxidoreductase TM_0325-like [Papilio polytes]|uniref:uncharacterized oxidoreductase TM_0325-like n=1 Tax=Papilio polytes TaxID=76194 RepID=UPI0006765712|nr:PREDICTED: uncharacterized oxidoreductase TM_0325-like [Papilio polytes]
MSFCNKVVLITGAGSGIGAATAIAFSKQSAKLSLVDINEKDLNKTAEICKTNEVLKVVADLARDEDIKRIFDETIAKYGKLDILVNCAGTYMPSNIESENLMKIYDRIQAVNLRSIVALTNCAVNAIIEAKGSVISICSVSAKLTTKYNIPYSVSKAGLLHFTKCAAIELADKGVRVNCISPGVVKTNIFQSSGLNEKEISMCLDTCVDSTPLGSMIQPEEIADMVLYLSSDKARNITGTDYVVDGGMLLNGLIVLR